MTPISKHDRSLSIKRSWPILVILISVFLYINAGFIQAPGRLPGQIEPAFWPRAILIALIVCSILRIILNLRRGLPASVSEPDTEKVAKETMEDRRNWKILVLAMLSVFCFVLAIDNLGFLLSSLLFLWAFTYLGRWRKKIYLPLIAIMGTIVITYLFVKLVYIPLPKGRSLFEDVTIALYRVLGIF
ncbi:MAG: tripartite tricarboxylate transporter TctB family protein [Thermodesulfobacteriota bacterium]|nr:tripartite tricarboxylate transporter TctB family protein [Thermodesulfobacteriota bacterium]